MNMAYYRRKKGNKYGSKKVTCGGEVFDSKKEARRFQALKILEKAGDITDLRRQVPFELIPNQYVPTDEIYRKGPKKGQPKMKLAERKCVYIADFVYIDSSGRKVVEDTKGVRTKDYIIKRKLMLFVHGIQVNEV